ncbi:MAG: hypothetical protein AB1597_06560 [Chloroflexota bacterium]
MLKSKYFWIAILLCVPFIIVWVMEGLGWAIATYVVVGAFFLFVLTSARRRKRRTYYYDGGDIYIVKDEKAFIRRPQRRSPIQTGLDWHVPKINKDGVEFITGAKGIRKSQEDALRKTKKRFWG